MILTVGGIKGGSGKTTTACNIAATLAQHGKDVLLVDTDDQASAVGFHLQRESAEPAPAAFACTQLQGKAVLSNVRNFAPRYDHIVIDAGGRDTASLRAALLASDKVLVPFLPSSFDVWTLDDFNTVLEEAQSFNPDLEALAFINRADHAGNDNEEAAEAVREAGLNLLPAKLGNRKTFRNAAALGLGVLELPTNRDNEKAQAEFSALFRLVYNMQSLHNHFTESKEA